MGYLLKTEEDKYLVFYSKPEDGHYRSDTECLTREEYLHREIIYEHQYNDEFVWLDGWYDVDMEFENEACGVEVSEFIAGTILQGTQIEVNEPLEFNIKDHE